MKSSEEVVGRAGVNTYVIRPSRVKSFEAITICFHNGKIGNLRYIRDGDTVQVYTDDGRPVYFDSFGLFLLRVEEVYNDRHPLRHVLDPAPH